MSHPDSRNLPGPLEPAAPQDTMPELAGYIVNGLFSVGLSLESARSIVGNGPAGDRIAAATGKVDRMIRDVRTTLFGLVEDRPAVLEERMARTARALQVTALEAVARLERQADRARPPTRLDYPAEIKRWRAFADQAEQMARRWEQGRDPTWRTCGPDVDQQSTGTTDHAGTETVGQLPTGAMSLDANHHR